jgi:hypothetical protein
VTKQCLCIQLVTIPQLTMCPFSSRMLVVAPPELHPHILKLTGPAPEEGRHENKLCEWVCLFQAV